MLIIYYTKNIFPVKYNFENLKIIAYLIQVSMYFYVCINLFLIYYDYLV